MREKEIDKKISKVVHYLKLKTKTKKEQKRKEKNNKQQNDVISIDKIFVWFLH